MLCTACNKESKNLRVCPYCFTPYPTVPAPGTRASTRMSVPPGAAGGAGEGKTLLAEVRALVMGQSPVVRWSALGIALVAVLWAATSPGDASADAARTSQPVVSTPPERDSALAVIRETRAMALVDVQQDEVFVSYRAATFPVDEAGQRSLVERFARADGIAEGHHRRIFFYNPNGKIFAQSDASGTVVLVR